MEAALAYGVQFLLDPGYFTFSTCGLGAEEFRDERLLFDLMVLDVLVNVGCLTYLFGGCGVTTVVLTYCFEAHLDVLAGMCLES